jgi:hypothetical protein
MRLLWLSSMCALSAASPALARPEVPVLFCANYPDAPACRGQIPSCYYCHSSATPPVGWNSFGLSLVAVRGDGPIAAELARMLAEVEDADADGDGVTNGEEIRLGSLPANDRDRLVIPEPREVDSPYAIAEWDPAFALRRVKVAFCGLSPSYDEMKALEASGDPRAYVHEALSVCLESSYWIHEALPRIADPLVIPIGGASTCYGFYSNFEWDYWLFAYVLSGDRDARDLLRADYHVQRDASGALVRAVSTDARGRLPAPASRGSQPLCRDNNGNPVRGTAGEITAYSYTGGQALEPSQRAGMITTQWFLWRNTMGAFLPRQTAAAAYRAYLGLEISQFEGLYDVAGEPIDVDRKGVASEACAACHRTLDPIAYAFAPYWGGAGNVQQYVLAGIEPQYAGTYFPNRLYSRIFPAEWGQTWRTSMPTPRLFGEPTLGDGQPNLVAWAHRASDSDAFLRNLAERFFRHALGRAPRAGEFEEFTAAWAAMREDGYFATGLVHRLADTLAFGAP